MSGIIAAGYFLFSLFFSLILYTLWIRVILRFFKVSALHPISRTIYQLTNPVIRPIDQLSGFGKPGRSRYDWSCLIVIVLVEVIKYLLLSVIFLNQIMPLAYLGLYVMINLIVQPCNLLFYALLMRVIMSWVNPDWRHPVGEVIYLITEPPMQYVRKHLPDTAGIDFSPLFIIIILYVLTLILQGFLPLKL